jgi:hypothetical protein
MKSLKHVPQLSLDEPLVPQFPSFDVSGEQMPEIDSWEVDEEYTITVKVHMNGYSSHVDPNGKLRSHADFHMISYDVVK